MNIESGDIARLRVPLGLALGLLAVGGALIALGHEARAQAEGELREARVRHAALEQRLQQLGDSREEIGRAAEIYRQLQESGLADEEHRLDWGELLRDRQQRHALPELSYRILASRALDGDALPGFRASAMHLHLELVHEEDLTEFLAGIRHDARALVLARSCRMMRKPSAATESLARLEADCELDWVTLKGAEP